jgi:hypothetical protein
MSRKLVWLAVLPWLVWGCNKSSSGGSADEARVTGGEIVPILGSGPSTLVPVDGPVLVPGKYVVVDADSLRLQPTKAGRVDLPGRGNENNWVGRILRSRECTVLRSMGGWSEVKMEDGAEGWLPSRQLLPVEKVQMATVLEDTDAYSGPGGEVLPPEQKVEAGTVLYVVSVEGGYARVNVVGDQHTWVAKGKLVTDPAELQVARLIMRAKHAWAVDGMEDYAELIDQGRIKHKNAKLLPALLATVPPTELNKGDPVEFTSGPLH